MTGAGDTTVARIVDAVTWDQRVAAIRLIPQRHGTAEHAKIYAEIARRLYVEHLTPDFAFVNKAPFYEEPYFREVYRSAHQLTRGFRDVDESQLVTALIQDSRIMLVLRTITGLLRNEFSSATKLISEPLGLRPLSGTRIDAMERRGSNLTPEVALVAARTVSRILDGSLFADAVGNVRSKQDKLDTRRGWDSVRDLADSGVPFAMFLHQRHYGGPFRQIADATSALRGDVIEDAVEQLFRINGVRYIRTGSHNQADIERRFEITVRPAPDFVVYDDSGSLRAMLECKAISDGGTARDKAPRFERLKDEAGRLGGVPLIGVLGGIGWTRVNDTLGPVIRDTDGRVFTLATLPQMMTVAPFPSLAGLADDR